MNNADTKAKQQIVEKIKGANNILIAVSRDPSVDDLSAALALTALLNKMGKHATAIFSGAIPPAIEFLEPGKVFESTADSLRDFIIALDKEKADHLRYKIEGDVVKIFITPYRTVINSDDLEFSQGDFNVELVLALGVESQEHLDLALAAHGRILHDVSVATFSAGTQTSRLGRVDWHDDNASSLSEMISSISEALKTDKPLLDKQIATALLTGIVAATDRFSNTRTTSRVMTMAAQLMAAGADQQLIASKLQASHEIDDFTKNVTEEKPAEVAEEKVEEQPAPAPESIEQKPEEAQPSEPTPVEEKKAEDAAGRFVIEHEGDGEAPIEADHSESTLSEFDFANNENMNGFGDALPPSPEISHFSEVPVEPISAYAPEESVAAPEPEVQEAPVLNDNFNIPLPEQNDNSFAVPSSDDSAEQAILEAQKELENQQQPEQVDAQDQYQEPAQDMSSLMNDALQNADNAPADIFANVEMSSIPPMPDLPLPPPLPDFSTLPSPLPNLNVNMSENSIDNQPNGPVKQETNNSNDPSQFQIPGQQ